MAGKQTGEFTFKMTAFSISPGPAGSILIQVNSEGAATGFGQVLSTTTFVGGNSGTFSYCGWAALDNGESVTGIGSGTYETIAKHRIRTKGLVQISDGRSIESEGEADLASRSWNGKLFEK
jgi:hypothetical protein